MATPELTESDSEILNWSADGGYCMKHLKLGTKAQGTQPILELKNHIQL